MKKLMLIIVLLLTLCACSDYDEEAQKCAEADNGLSYDTCFYLLHR